MGLILLSLKVKVIGKCNISDSLNHVFIDIGIRSKQGKLCLYVLDLFLYCVEDHSSRSVNKYITEINNSKRSWNLSGNIKVAVMIFFLVKSALSTGDDVFVHKMYTDIITRVICVHVCFCLNTMFVNSISK